MGLLHEFSFCTWPCAPGEDKLHRTSAVTADVLQVYGSLFSPGRQKQLPRPIRCRYYLPRAVLASKEDPLSSQLYESELTILSLGPEDPEASSLRSSQALRPPLLEKFPIRPAPEPHPFYNVSKRALDIGVGVVLLLLLAPVIVVAAAVVAVAYRTNPFYISRRVGYRGREFPMVKIKSMRDGSDKVVPVRLNQTGGPTFKSAEDPRVTRVGRIVRLTSIDELPQLLSVVAGQMTLVGPRPPLPQEVALYTRPQLERLSVKPGITCIWQVSGRSDVQFRKWMAMDRVYVRRRTLLFDFWLLARTPWAVIIMRGAR